MPPTKAASRYNSKIALTPYYDAPSRAMNLSEEPRIDGGVRRASGGQYGYAGAFAGTHAMRAGRAAK